MFFSTFREGCEYLDVRQLRQLDEELIYIVLKPPRSHLYISGECYTVQPKHLNPDWISISKFSLHIKY